MQTIHFGSAKVTMTLGQMRDDYTLRFSFITSSKIYAEWSSLRSSKAGEKAFLKEGNDTLSTLLATHRWVVLEINVFLFASWMTTQIRTCHKLRYVAKRAWIWGKAVGEDGTIPASSEMHKITGYDATVNNLLTQQLRWTPHHRMTSTAALWDVQSSAALRQKSQKSQLIGRGTCVNLGRSCVFPGIFPQECLMNTVHINHILVVKCVSHPCLPQHQRTHWSSVV